MVLGEHKAWALMWSIKSFLGGGGANLFFVSPHDPFLLLLLNLALDRWDLGFSLQSVNILKGVKMYFCLSWEHTSILLFSLLISAIGCSLHV